jgi:uncharacterized DUF497 family protein
MKFEWDINKEYLNIRKHKVNFSEACLVFADKYLLNLFDNEHSTEEERWITLGQTPYGKILIVVHTYRNVGGQDVIRIISARKATKNETNQYFKRRL